MTVKNQDSCLSGTAVRKMARSGTVFFKKKKKYIEGQLGQHSKRLSKTENTTNKKVEYMGEKL